MLIGASCFDICAIEGNTQCAISYISTRPDMRPTAIKSLLG